jgi:hypothetical protein
MSFTLSGTTITQSGTDNNSSGLASVAGITAPAGGRLYASADNIVLLVTGQYQVPIETLQLGRIGVTTASSVLTIGNDDGNPVSGGVIYLQSPSNDSSFATGVLYGVNGATLNLRNVNIVFAAGAQAEIGAQGAVASMNFKNVRFFKVGTAKGWNYLGGAASTFENVLWRNCEAVFFNSSPTLATGLSIVDSNWGFGIDAPPGQARLVTLTNSKVPRAVIQRMGVLTLLDCQITDWVACRLLANAVGSFIFSRNVAVSAIGSERASSVFRLYDKDNVVRISGTTNASGVIAKQIINWGKVSTNRIGENINPNTLANKFTADNINNNTGIGHDAGEYKLPLTAVFYKYNAVINSQSNITFDVTNESILSDYVLSPNIASDTNVTLTEANAIAKLASSFSVNTATNTITVTANSTLDDLYDVMKVYKTRPIQAQLEYPTISTQPVTASGDTLVTAMSVVGLEFLTAGTKFKKLQANGTASGTIANLTVNGNVSQATPTNLSNVVITGTLTYNTNTNIEITITNSTIDTVVNNGTGVVTINKVNSTISNYTDAEINFIDSTIAVIGADTVTFHPTANNRDLNINASGSFTSSYAFKFGSVVNGSTMSGTLYLRCVAGGIPFDINKTIVLGDNLVDLGTTAQLASLSAKIDLTAKEATLLQTEADIITAIGSGGGHGGGGLTLAQIEASTVLAKEATVASRASQASVNAIPTNPVLSNDARLNNLDTPISSRLADVDYVDPATPQNVLDAKTEVLEAISEIPTTDISGLALEATSQEIKAKTDKMEFNAQNHIAANVHQLQTGAINAIQDGLSLEATSQDIITKVDAIQTSVDNIDVDFTPVLDAVATKPTLSEMEASSVLANKTDITTAQTSIETKIDAIPETDLTLVAKESTVQKIKQNTDLIPATL